MVCQQRKRPRCRGLQRQEAEGREWLGAQGTQVVGKTRELSQSSGIREQAVRSSDDPLSDPMFAPDIAPLGLFPLVVHTVHHEEGDE